VSDINILSFYIPEWFFVALSFIILVVVLSKILWKPVNKILTERQTKISTALEHADSVEIEFRETESRRAALEAELEQKTLDQMKDARVRAGKEYDRIVTEAENKARAILAGAHEQTVRERDGILSSARAEVIAAALAATGVLLESNVNSEANERLIEQFLSRKGSAV
jgi:F-type H+-transporting ATPase subunit b